MNTTSIAHMRKTKRMISLFLAMMLAVMAMVLPKIDSHADPENIDVLVVVVWDDDDDSDGIRPNSLSGSLAGIEFTLLSINDWSERVSVPADTSLDACTINNNPDGYTCNYSIENNTITIVLQHQTVPAHDPTPKPKPAPKRQDRSSVQSQNDNNEDNDSDNEGSFESFMAATDLLLNNALNNAASPEGSDALRRTGITIEAGNWVSLKKELYEKIDKLTALGIPVTIKYNYMHKAKSVTIPAYNNNKIPTVNMCNLEGYCGFEYLAEVLVTGKLRPLNM